MSKFAIRLTVVLILLAGAAALSARILYPTKMVRGQLQAAALPLQLGGWMGQDVKIEEYVKQILETDDVVQRNYTNPLYRNAPVQMAIVYSSDNRRVAHPPEICYKGGGWEINGKQPVQLDPALPDMIRLQISRGRENRELVLYCFKTGEIITADYLQQQVNIVKNQLRMRSSSSALLRFSTRQQPTESEAETQARLVSFIKQMMPEIKKTLE